MRQERIGNPDCLEKPDQIGSYFVTEWKPLLAVTVSGLIYNIGLLAGPWFEGRLAQCLLDVFTGKKIFTDMLLLMCAYVAVIGFVQGARYIKRFYVRRFANDINRSMKQVLYGNLVHKSVGELEKEGVGSLLTKAVSDVDACVEGIRKFTTEIFDTGIALLAYAAMLLWYDWRLALLCLLFPPFSYLMAEKMKTVVERSNAAYKESAGRLNTATLDRAGNAVTYRIYGCENSAAACMKNSWTITKNSSPCRDAGRSDASAVSGDFHGKHRADFVFRFEKCLKQRMGGLEHRSVYDIFILLWKACGQVLEGGEAV